MVTPSNFPTQYWKNVLVNISQEMSMSKEYINSFQENCKKSVKEFIKEIEYNKSQLWDFISF
jgi:hypothetical protein